MVSDDNASSMSRKDTEPVCKDALQALTEMITSGSSAQAAGCPPSANWRSLWVCPATPSGRPLAPSKCSECSTYGVEMAFTSPVSNRESFSRQLHSLCSYCRIIPLLR